MNRNPVPADSLRGLPRLSGSMEQVLAGRDGFRREGRDARGRRDRRPGTGRPEGSRRQAREDALRHGLAPGRRRPGQEHQEFGRADPSQMVDVARLAEQESGDLVDASVQRVGRRGECRCVVEAQEHAGERHLEPPRLLELVREFQRGVRLVVEPGRRIRDVFEEGVLLTGAIAHALEELSQFRQGLRQSAGARAALMEDDGQRLGIEGPFQDPDGPERSGVAQRAEVSMLHHENHLGGEAFALGQRPPEFSDLDARPARLDQRNGRLGGADCLGRRVRVGEPAGAPTQAVEGGDQLPGAGLVVVGQNQMGVASHGGILEAKSRADGSGRSGGVLTGSFVPNRFALMQKRQLALRFCAARDDGDGVTTLSESPSDRLGPKDAWPRGERRAGVDRRARPTKLLSWHLFRGKRARGRRAGESSNIYVDRYRPGDLGLALSILVLNILDALFTLLYLAVGGLEANPIARGLLDLGTGWFVFTKAFVIALCVLFLTVHKTFRHVRPALWVLLAFYSALLLWHLWLQIEVWVAR